MSESTIKPAEVLPCLPALREDLAIVPGIPDSTGEKTWLIHDGLAHKFHAISHRAFLLLSHWRPVTVKALIASLTHKQSPNSPPYTEADIEEMTHFLFAHKLTTLPPGLDTEALRQQELAVSPPLYKQLLHKYLFFKIPLFRPYAFLRAAWPCVAPLYSRPFFVFVLLSGIIGFWLALEQWESFKTTFLYFLSFEGLLYYGLTLIVLKSAHELGHAFMAYRFGVKVPTIGVAFLVMFPILYTDTTEAWRLTDRRQRVLIDAGGVLVELTIASLSLLAWSFLPDGPVRSAAFFAATTSWVMSLAVNLNPMMRFDGYYLASDLFNQKNLQERSFALGRWFLRETLFGLKAPKPFISKPLEQISLTIYAYCVWVYRFFLFIGIAVLVHAMFPKALGIVLFGVEITFFIFLPIWREVLHWWYFRMSILKTTRGRVTTLLAFGAISLLFLPWQQTVHAPALLRPAVHTRLYPVSPGRIEEIRVHEGDRVHKGQVLLRLSSPTLAHEKQKSRLRIKLLQSNLARLAADRQDLSQRDILQSSLNKELTHLSGLEALAAELEIRAPFSGRLVQLNPELHTGRWINDSTLIAHLIDPAQSELLAYAGETSVERLHTGNALTFIAEDPLFGKVAGRLVTIAPTNADVLDAPVLSSVYNGPIAVNTPTPSKQKGRVQAGQDRPAAALIRLTARPERDTPLTHAVRGQIIIEARPESPARKIWRQISKVLIREADF